MLLLLFLLVFSGLHVGNGTFFTSISSSGSLFTSIANPRIPEVSQTGPTLALSNLDTDSSASPLRHRKNRSKRQDTKASPTGGRADQFLVSMEVEREEHNSLPYQMKNCLLQLEECTTSKGKASNLSEIVIDIAVHIMGGNEDKFDEVLQSVAGKLSNDGVSKGVGKLFDNIANLVINGSTTIWQIGTSLLLSSLTTEE